MTMGVGILTLPALSSSFGLLGGTIALIFGFSLCLLSFRFIIYCSVNTEIKEYSQLVENLLPPFVANIFKVTYFGDMQCFSIVYSVFGWKLFEFILNIFGLLKDEWIKDITVLELHEYNPSLFLLRIVYFVVLYILMVPLLL